MGSQAVRRNDGRISVLGAYGGSRSAKLAEGKKKYFQATGAVPAKPSAGYEWSFQSLTTTPGKMDDIERYYKILALSEQLTDSLKSPGDPVFAPKASDLAKIAGKLGPFSGNIPGLSRKEGLLLWYLPTIFASIGAVGLLLMIAGFREGAIVSVVSGAMTATVFFTLTLVTRELRTRMLGRE